MDLRFVHAVLITVALCACVSPRAPARALRSGASSRLVVLVEGGEARPSAARAPSKANAFASGTLSIDVGGIAFRAQDETLLIPWHELTSFATNVENGQRTWTFHHGGTRPSEHVLHARHAEDEATTRTLLVTLLEQSGFELGERRLRDASDAYDPADAGLRQLEARPPTKATDVRAPKRDPNAAPADRLYPNAHALHDFALGMTLTAFEATPFPSVAGHAVRVVRSTDAGVGTERALDVARLRDADWRAAGVVQALHLTKTNDHAALAFGLEGIEATFWFFAGNADDEPRLFLIDARAPTARYDELRRLLATRLGAQPKIGTETVATGTGATYCNDVAWWTRPSSQVFLSRYGDTVHSLRLRYVLTSLHDRLVQRLDEL